MKKNSLFLLKIPVVLIALIAISAMIRFPLTEGRATNLDLISIYSDPFIIYLYISSIPFFIALHQIFKILVHVEKKNIFSRDSIKAMGKIKYSAIALIVLIAGAISYVFTLAKTTNDDGAGAIAVGMVTIMIFGVIAVIAAKAQTFLRTKTMTKSSG